MHRFAAAACQRLPPKQPKRARCGCVVMAKRTATAQRGRVRIAQTTPYATLPFATFCACPHTVCQCTVLTCSDGDARGSYRA